MSGPRVVSQVVAPYLWHRRIRRIDEVFLSHGDMDHFNGLPALLTYFSVGQVSWTPTFSDRSTPGVHAVLEAIQHAGIATRVITAGESLAAGDVQLHVLHPPPQGPIGTENTRSLTLLVQYAGYSIVLTGDLEGIGQEMVQRWPIPPAAVLMAPHHGGKTANAAGRTAQGELVPSPRRPGSRKLANRGPPQVVAQTSYSPYPALIPSECLLASPSTQLQGFFQSIFGTPVMLAISGLLGSLH